MLMSGKTEGLDILYYHSSNLAFTGWGWLIDLRTLGEIFGIGKTYTHSEGPTGRSGNLV